MLRQAATMGNELWRKVLWMVYTRSRLPLHGFHLVAALVGLVALMHSTSAHLRADSIVQYAGPTTPPQTHAPHLVRGSLSWPGVCAHFSCPVVFRPCVLIQSRPLPLTPILPSTIILDTPSVLLLHPIRFTPPSSPSPSPFVSQSPHPFSSPCPRTHAAGTPMSYSRYLQYL